jgi:hypothetical protein
MYVCMYKSVLSQFLFDKAHKKPRTCHAHAIYHSKLLSMMVQSSVH